MFNLDDFKDSLILEKVEKLDKHLSKNKIQKISKIINELENLLEDQNYTVPITYILSILAENKIDLSKRWPEDSVNKGFRHNILLALCYLKMGQSYPNFEPKIGSSPRAVLRISPRGC